MSPSKLTFKQVHDHNVVAARHDAISLLKMLQIDAIFKEGRKFWYLGEPYIHLNLL